MLADQTQIQQVLLNLLMNAVEAMQTQHTPHRRLEVTVTHDAAETVVAVRDSGPGIAQDQQGRVFEAFWTTKAKGIGIGLHISRSIIESHGGRMWFTPHPEGGVTFWRFPPTGRGRFIPLTQRPREGRNRQSGVSP